MARYQGDPRWLEARYEGKCGRCDQPIRKGDRIFYYPGTRTALARGCGHAEEGRARLRGAPTRRGGVLMDEYGLEWRRRDRKCLCGSGLNRHATYDARGIFLAYVCEKCERKKLSGYRPDVLNNPNYEADEQIEED